MLNVDKYREAILCGGADMDRLDCHIAALRGVGTVACAHNMCKMCMQASFKWLFSEYEPSLLENGNGLKPGDWVMVRDNEDGVWENRQFLAYFDGWFYARKIVPDGWREKIDRFKQARLPEDGE